MPELPEVETIVKELSKKVLNRTFIDVWTDSLKIIKEPKEFKLFKSRIKNKKIKKIWRKGKNIIFDLSDGLSLLIHQKLTGHLLLGNWKFLNRNWQAKEKGVLRERENKYIHLMFLLDDGKQLALSDLRKFAKVELRETKELNNSREFRSLGPEPLEKSFGFKEFKKIIKNKRGKIKQILMNQEIIAGIGNIYSDEILWKAKINPFKDTSELKEKQLKEIYKAMKEILSKAVKLGGTSISDFRRLSGKKGGFEKELEVYRKKGKKCSRCKTIIERKKIGGRSSHFCPKCQKI